MANIGFLTDLDPGHINPLMQFAAELGGHKIYFLGLVDIQPMITSQGWNFEPLFEEIYPLGFIRQYLTLQLQHSAEFVRELNLPRAHLGAILRGDVRNVTDRLQLDILVVPFSLALESLLIKATSNIPVVIFTTWLRRPALTPRKKVSAVIDQLPPQDRKMIQQHFNTEDLAEITTALEGIPEIIGCPGDFEISKNEFQAHVAFTGPLVKFLPRDDGFFERYGIPENKQIIYVSFGSQTALFQEKAREIIDFIVDAFEHTERYFLILSLGRQVTSEELQYFSGKAYLRAFSWTPQLEILNHASLMITHGGLGAIKECICCEVPMLVIPFLYDQHENARRVAFHQLGAVLHPETLSESVLKATVHELTSSATVAERISFMNKKFRTHSNDHAMEVIENAMRTIV